MPKHWSCFRAVPGNLGLYQTMNDILNSIACYTCNMHIIYISVICRSYIAFYNDVLIYSTYPAILVLVTSDTWSTDWVLRRDKHSEATKLEKLHIPVNNAICKTSSLLTVLSLRVISLLNFIYSGFYREMVQYRTLRFKSVTMATSEAICISTNIKVMHCTGLNGILK